MMRNFGLYILIVLTLSIAIFSCEKEESVQEPIKKSTKEEYQLLIESLQNAGDAIYFLRMLNNADLQFDDSSKLTVFVIADNPYIRNTNPSDESYLKNHLVKGAYHVDDFSSQTQLTALSGKKLEIREVSPENNTFRINNTSSLENRELEVDGNIIHYVYSPIFCDESDYADYFNVTKMIFTRYLEYAFHFDAIFSDISNSVGSSWIEIDNHTFNAENDKIEKLWFDAYRILNRNASLAVYEPEAYNDVFAENRLFQLTATSFLLNYFGGIPLYTNPRAFRNLLPRASEGEIIQWITDIADRTIQKAENNNLKNAAKAISARISFFQGGLINHFQASLLSESIINSGFYELEEDQAVVYTDDSAENIYFVNNPYTINSEIAAQKSVLPVFRISESFLISSYSAVMERNENAFDLLKYYQERKGLPVLDDSATFEEAYEKLTAYFLDEFVFDGIRFSLLRKLNLSEEVLLIPDYMKMLPIPMKAVKNNPNIFQNPGY